MYKYTCGCGTEWHIRSKEEPWVTKCPGCGKKKATEGRNQSGKRPANIAGTYGENEIQKLKPKKVDPIKEQDKIDQKQKQKMKDKKSL